jgi:hypothetical protein
MMFQLLHILQSAFSLLFFFDFSQFCVLPCALNFRFFGRAYPKNGEWNA